MKNRELVPSKVAVIYDTYNPQEVLDIVPVEVFSSLGIGDTIIIRSFGADNKLIEIYKNIADKQIILNHTLGSIDYNIIAG